MGLQRRWLVVALPLLGGCEGERRGEERSVSVPAPAREQFDSAMVENGRLNRDWRRFAERDRRLRNGALPTLPPAEMRADAEDPADRGPLAPRPPASETFEDITPATVNRSPPLPIPREGAGPSALHVQVLLDRVDFSPGVLDGRWGKNTEKAVYWFQHEEGLEPTGEVDEETYARLRDVADDPPLLGRYELTGDDLDGPFVSVPAGIYDKAELDCLCYESPVELLAERFHTTRDVVARLNPGLDLDSLRVGLHVLVPNVADRSEDDNADIARIVISSGGFYTQALDDDGEIVFHFPSTLGSRYYPSPTGRYRVVTVVPRPRFHYEPELFSGIPDDRPDTVLPPGPNSPVGVVWMGLSKDHYGIHGTSRPSTIGYVTSHGCVRLTNWDARRLANHLEPGTPVEFR